jgi:hypothetical protein
VSDTWYFAWVIDWYEREAGWGRHDEGCSLHRDEAALDRYVAAQRARWPELEPNHRRRWRVDEETWRALQDVDGLALRSPPPEPED